jgi:acetyl esterase/lipase
LRPEHHAYGRARSQYGELFRPADPTGPAPVAVLLHGGAYGAQRGRKLMHRLCTDLARRGWAAWNLEYRRLGLLSGGGWPCTLEDVAAGIDHLEELAPPGAGHPVAGRPGPLDLGRVVAIGHSSGGHLAAWSAARPGLPRGAPGALPRVRVRGVVAQAGLLDLHRAGESGLRRAIVRLLDGRPEERAERYELASPAARLPLGVPLLLVHGARDDVIPAALSEGFASAARAAGDACECVVVPGEGHFGHLDPRNPMWDVVGAWLGAQRP